MCTKLAKFYLHYSDIRAQSSNLFVRPGHTEGLAWACYQNNNTGVVNTTFPDFSFICSIQEGGPHGHRGLLGGGGPHFPPAPSAVPRRRRRHGRVVTSVRASYALRSALLYVTVIPDARTRKLAVSFFKKALDGTYVLKGAQLATCVYELKCCYSLCLEKSSYL